MVQVLVEDISEGRERVRIPVVVDGPTDGITAPTISYTADYSASPAAARVLTRLYADHLIQWAGTAQTDPACGGEALPDFASDGSVCFTPGLLLDRIQFTPCFEDIAGAATGMPECASALLPRSRHVRRLLQFLTREGLLQRGHAWAVPAAASVLDGRTWLGRALRDGHSSRRLCLQLHRPPVHQRGGGRNRTCE